MRRRIRRLVVNLVGNFMPNGLVKTYALWALGLPPVAGAEDPPADPPKDDPPKDDPPKNDDEWTPPSKEEWDNAQRKAREAETERKRLADEKAERERKKAEDEGEFKSLYEQEKAEREREKAERERKDAEIERERREAKAERIATRLKFRDPSDVIGKLTDADLETEAKTEKALTKIADQKKYLLVDGEKRTTRDADGEENEGTPSGGKSFGESRLSKAFADDD
jgi:hypothetical protein